MENKDYLSLVQNKCQSYADRILGALNPINSIDLPFIAFALNKVLSVIETDLDDSQQKVYETAKESFESYHTKTDARKDLRFENKLDVYSTDRDFCTKNCKGGGKK